MVNLVKKALPVGVKHYVKQRLIELRRQITQDTSQHGESAYLRTLVSPDSPPYVVDVGAYDGRTMSNSYYFIQKLGWKGLLVEPLPANFELLTALYKDKPSVICVNKAISDSAGIQKLYVGTHGSVSTLCTDDHEWFREHRTEQTIDIETDTLTNLLSQHQFPKDISLLSIDTEGLDYEVLTSLDFSRFQPRVIITEEYGGNPDKLKKKHQLLIDNGYRLVNTLATNTIWLRDAQV
jgi:FkbM family methyltransferase